MRAFERIAHFTPGDAICEVTTSTTKWFFARTSSAATRKSVQAACALLHPCHRTLTARAPTPKSFPHAGAACSPRPAPDARPLPPREHPAAPARKSETARSRSRRSAQPEPLLPWIPRPPAPPCDPLAVSATVCAPVPAAVSKPHPSSSSNGFRSSGSSFPRPPLPPFAFPSQPPPLVGVVLSRPQHLLASRHRLPPVPVMPLVLPTRDSPRPTACRFLPLPAPPTCLRPPLPTSDPLRSPPVPHRPITGKRRPNHEQVNTPFVYVSDAHARRRRGAFPLPFLI